MFLTIVGVLASYFLGSIPAAAWLARARGVDIRQVGSGNSGATNVLRSLGKGPALIVATFDILKGVLAVVLAHLLGLDAPWVSVCAVVAVVGHNFSPFLSFRGGKGVATSFGAVTVLDPVTGMGAFILAITCMWLTKYVSAGSILAAVAAIILVISLQREIHIMLPVIFLAVLLIWQHRGNLKKLQAGTERKLGEKG